MDSPSQSPPPSPPPPPASSPPPVPRPSSDPESLSSSKSPLASSSARTGDLPGNVPVVRRYPKPPALLPRILMLLLRPETWAEAARYPTRITLVPLLLVIFIASLAVGIGISYRQYQSYQQFAASYDARYPALELASDGSLKVAGNSALPEPIRFQTVVVDPTGKTSAATIKTPFTFLITDRQLLFVNFFSEGVNYQENLSNIPNLVPPAGQVKRIDGAMLSAYVRSHVPSLLVFPVIAFSVARFIGEILWCALIMFLICPLVVLATAGMRVNADGPDRRLLIPRRAAYRISAAVLVPIIAVDGALWAVNHPASGLLGGEGANLFWFFSAAALAVWSGFMARRMYAPTVSRRHT